MKAAYKISAPPDKRVVRRALKLRDAALHVRDLVEGWQPGHCVTAVHTAGFRISYRDPASAMHFKKAPASEKGLPDRSLAITIHADSKLLELEWDDADVDVKFFQRGDWETDFLRLARSR